LSGRSGFEENCLEDQDLKRNVKKIRVGKESSGKSGFEENFLEEKGMYGENCQEDQGCKRIV